MKVFIANFGRENYAWPDCLARGTIATMNDVAVQRFWEVGDRESYIQNRMRLHKTAAGKMPTRPVASRWFNLMTTVVESEGDLWIHREKDQLWWTVSGSAPATFEPLKETVGDRRDVIICHKPCDPWLNRNRKGNRLEWAGLHPKAQEFLFTEGTLQQLKPDNAEYALKLIDGDDLSTWYSRPEWKAKVARRQKTPGKVFNPREIAVWRMADTLKKTVAAANGQQVLRTVKNKELRIPENELIPFLNALLSDQDGSCAITGLRLQYDTDADDPQMLCSLDRIDSNGHYEKDNLQIVCKFVNRWKNSSDDDEFRRLIMVLQGEPDGEEKADHLPDLELWSA
ncbi:hypothetical protein N7E70_010875 [Aminobacter sp. NyZ550]|uniref:hypothetical protein n=1 Tax=Aminobacter sp. NyZ550 TaxID=2979870 RepID=UPI0021D5E11E|nr:hypothetical protein [Aminobacter sp. NyZ550]WAX97314.1 hypothetical protein N7E70_010875 [Aminobacter sp. NyZ550]